VVRYLGNQFPRGYYKTFANGLLLLPNLGTWYGFNQISEYDAMGLRNYQQLKQHIGFFGGGMEVFNNMPNFNALRFLGAKYLVFPKNMGMYLIQKSPKQFRLAIMSERVVILEQPAMPRAYILNVPDRKQLDVMLKDLMINPDESHVLSVKSYHLDKNGSENVYYSISKPGFLVLNENYYPGWVAQLDNQHLEIENLLGLRVIPVPAGNHTINIFYKPNSFRQGLVLSLCSLFIWLILAIYAYKEPKTQ